MKTMSFIVLMSFECLYRWLWTDFSPCSGVFYVNFEQANAGCLFFASQTFHNNSPPSS